MHTGVIHLDGGEALAFARSRHTTTDYDRSRRQHVLIAAVIAKVRQMGMAAIGPLAKYAFQEIQTDVPASALPQMVGLATAANLDHVKSVVLGPRTFATGGSILYSIYIKLKAVRATFQKIFSH
jgi:anionic cell wall polymer biosynthesis LytR-Cps2A-Psr (LCP) family protein